ncbi:hypothetical protein ABZ626_34080 [Streptomyces longispororuber]|uniref:hypothetical protein n=1 Tax=Streptomyces longispororuber TaxID=68230 RepID=UPI0033F94A9F
MAPAQEQERGDSVQAGPSVASGQQGFGGVQREREQPAQVQQPGAGLQLRLGDAAQGQVPERDQEADDGQVHHGRDQRRDPAGDAEPQSERPDVADGEDEGQGRVDRHDHGHGAPGEPFLRHARLVVA